MSCSSLIILIGQTVKFFSYLSQIILHSLGLSVKFQKRQQRKRTRVLYYMSSEAMSQKRCNCAWCSPCFWIENRLIFLLNVCTCLFLFISHCKWLTKLLSILKILSWQMRHQLIKHKPWGFNSAIMTWVKRFILVSKTKELE